MRHEITVEGYAFRLRPLTIADAEFVVGLRTDPILSRFINPTSPYVEDQVAWTERYYQRPDDCSFICERLSGQPEGMVSIYDIRDDEAYNGKTAEWGRWILRSGSPAALECAILVYRTAFEKLSLDSVYCRTVAANKSVVAFHTSTGLETRQILKDYVVLKDVLHDSIEQIMTKRHWWEIRPSLENKAQRLAKKLSSQGVAS